ncbi:MAG: M15 family metallopeptidase [Candidatus Saccharimonadales bacterium]
MQRFLRRRKWVIIILSLALLVLALLLILRTQITLAPGNNTLPGVTNTPPAHTYDKTAHSLVDPTSIWVIVNKQHPLTILAYAPNDLTTVGNGQYLRAEAATELTQMIAAAKTDGFTLTPASGYRSYATQVNVYGNEVRGFGQAIADSESARPGYSEHQTGLAMDLGSGGCNIQDCFGDTPGGKWAIANSYRYGFILRYPASLSDITGYRNETWHFRYVGASLAGEMHKQKIQTLEQFFDIPGGTTYKS